MVVLCVLSLSLCVVCTLSLSHTRISFTPHPPLTSHPSLTHHTPPSHTTPPSHHTPPSHTTPPPHTPHTTQRAMELHGGDMEAAATWLVSQAPERQGSLSPMGGGPVGGAPWAGAPGPSPTNAAGGGGMSASGGGHTRTHSIAAGKQTLMAVTGRLFGRVSSSGWVVAVFWLCGCRQCRCGCGGLDVHRHCMLCLTCMCVFLVCIAWTTCSVLYPPQQHTSQYTHNNTPLHPYTQQHTPPTPHRE